MAVGMTSVFGRLRLARFFAVQLRDVVVVGAVCAIVVVLARIRFTAAVIEPVQGTYVLILITAGLAAGAALCAFVTYRLEGGDPRPAWIAAALALYGVFVLPLSSALLTDPDYAAGRLASVTVFLVAMALMLMALRRPERLRAWGGGLLLIAGAALGLVILSLPDTSLTLALARGRIVPLIALLGWAVVSVAFVIDGYRTTNPRRARLGLGLLVVAISQLYRDSQAATMPTDLIFPALRVVGMVVVLLALLQVVQRSVSSLQSDFDQAQSELDQAGRSLETATDLFAEKNHEMRNGLAALAGVVHVLSSSDGDEQGERFRQLLLNELSRLRTMLDTPLSELLDDPGPDGDDAAGSHRVRPVLENLVGLRVHQDIDLQTEGELCAATQAAVTEQIVTNLLVNCDRHAPGTPVVVRGRTGTDGTVVIEVRDSGPGLPDGGEDAVFERGVHDESAGGSGLGLHISRRLAEENGGTLQLRTVQNPMGCLAVLTLPSVDC